MLCTIYYLLYGSEIFSDYLFLQDVTVLLMKFKKSSINAVKLIPKFYIETGSAKLSDSFSFPEWTKRILLGFVYNVYIKLTSYSERGGRTGLVVRASDSGSGDPGSILGRVRVLFP